MQRQIVDVAIGESAEGPAVHRELARPFWDRAVPELERVFDAVVGPHELLRLDRLELDLGQIDGEDWPTEFRKKLVAELSRSLTRFAAAPTADEQPAPLDARRAEPWQEFLFYLVHGYLPWWGARAEDGWTGTLQQLDGAGWSAVRDTVAADARARVRFVQSVSDEFLDTALGTWVGVWHAARVLARWTATSLRVDGQKRWRRAFWMTVFDWAHAGGPRTARGGPQLVRELLRLRRTESAESGHHEQGRSSAHHAAEHGRPNPFGPEEELPSPWREWLSEATAAPLDRSEAEMRTGAGSRRHAGPTEFPGRRPPETNPRPADQEAIYLDGAGAILLHPFLEQLFRDRGLLDGRGFRDTDARHRAVHLFGLLAFGRVDVPEHQLVFGKTLCGVVLEEPLDLAQLEDGDVVACDAILRAVLEHWTALRSSSPEWLRQQFLLREGKLEAVDSGYLLTIERRAQDVLLARLPWGFGVVALPWLTERVFVRWLD